MPRTVPILSLLAALSISGSASEPKLSKEDKVFFEGVNAGMMTMHENSVLDAFNGLLLLQNVAGTESYRRLLVTRLNTALFALSFVDRDVTIRPAMLKTVAEMSSSRTKGFMADLRKARIEYKWQSSDAKQEASIGWVLDRYVKTGNIYGFQ